jgi:hypothetical protein
MLDGYTHGTLQCRLCFGESKETTLSLGDWRLLNNPGYYGSNDPEILVLGFSKGMTQIKVAERADFDKIAFANARNRLRAIFEVLKIMPSDRGIDELMTSSETTFGIASLVRCSLSKVDKNGRFKTSGDLIPSAFTNPTTLAVIRRCAFTFLSCLPKNVRLVILLGISNAYIVKTRRIFADLYSDFAPQNEVAFRAGGALWIYTTHPSPANGHFNDWVSGGHHTPSGRKRILALQALSSVS